ncbi:phospholipid carrier-dependent glycosyltransferase, partial [Candidatus Daviesbacteria bacterium]|nr:phospholipid carrier-dependent glycosyltransferase [Candidatus Daviesbacteria bacterium]
MIKKIILILVIVLAALLRFWQLSDYPPHANWDEASLGYNAYSILTTGRDEWGQFLPLTFRAFGDYKLPGYIYTSVPFVAAFGLNEFSIRFASAFFGTLTVLLVFLLARLLTRKYSLATIAAFLLAISPWHVFLSRIALEANLALFFLVLGIFLFVKFITQFENRIAPQLILLIACPLSLVAALYTYNSARVVVPLLVLLLAANYYSLLKKLKKQLVLMLVLLVVLSVPAFSLAIKQDSSARYRWTAILDEGATNFINESRRTSAYPTPLKELVYNKITYTLPRVVAGYLSHFSPDFLYFKGGSNFQFNIPGFGLFYPLEMPFLVLGVMVAFWQKSPWRWLL